MGGTLTQADIEDVITAAIDADMKERGFYRVGETYLYPAGVDESSGEVPQVPAPGHGPTGVVDLDPGHINGQDSRFTHSINATEEVYNPWRERIEAAFTGWTELPEPSDFTSLYHQFDRGTALLKGGGGAPGSNTAGNVDLAATVNTITTELAKFEGATVDAFHHTYVSRFDTTFANQSLCGAALTIAAKAEADIWSKANEHIVMIATQAKTAFEESGHGGGGGEVTFKVLGILASTVGLVIPAAAAGAATVGTVLGIINNAGSLLPKAESTTSLAGGSSAAVYEKLVQAISDLDRDIGKEESRIADMLWDSYSVIIGPNRSEYDLSRPTGLFEETDINKLNETDVDTGSLKTIGNTHMPSLAGYLRSAATELDVGDSGIWSRPSGIGSGYTGPFHEANSLSNQLIDYLTVTAQECEDAGEVLVIAANHLDSTDAAASTALRDHRDDIEEEPANYGRPARDGGWYTPDGKYLSP